MKKFSVSRNVLMAIAPKSNGLLKKEDFYEGQILTIQGIEEADGGDLTDEENRVNGRASIIFKVNDGSLIRIPLGSFINQKIVGVNEDADKATNRVYNLITEGSKTAKAKPFELPSTIKVVNVEPSLDFNGNKRYPASAYKVFQEALEERKDNEGFEFGQLYEDTILMGKCRGEKEEQFSTTIPEPYKLLTLELSA